MGALGGVCVGGKGWRSRIIMDCLEILLRPLLSQIGSENG